MANFLQRLKHANQRYSFDERQMSTQEADANLRNPDDIRIGSIVPRLNSSGGSSQTELSDVDLNQIGQAYYSDSYISRAINKIVGLMFKEGWNFTSRNTDALKYIETRFKLMEESTHIKTNTLLREIGLNYVLYGNAVVAKTRGTENTGELEYQGYYDDEPISGLFSGSPEMFSIVRDEEGNVQNYLLGTGAEEVEFGEEDILHMTYQKPSGLAFGVPYITNVVRDVLVLRQIEQTVTNILYRNLHPLQVYTVGVAEPGMEAKPGEIETVEETIQSSSLDSMFIVPERHKIEAVRNDFVDANGYLKYFRQRVFTGLGVSESTMGVGDTANRSTSDNQSSDLIDLVKDFQQNFAYQFQRLIDELLFEGGYDPTLIPEDRVNFEFVEIEQATKIARENHEVQLFMQNAQSLDETRLKMGLEPIDDLSRFYFNLFGKNNSENTGANKDQPENQHGKQDAPAENFPNNNPNINVKETDLTDFHKKVNLIKDEKYITLSQAWEQTLTKMNTPCPKEEFINLFSVSLNNNLFDSKEAKETFVSIIANQLMENQLINKTSDKMYHFSESLIASYDTFDKLKKRG